MEAKDNVKKSSSVSGLRIQHVSGSVVSPTEGVHVEITTEENSQGVGDRNNSSSTSADDKEDDENMPSLSSEQLARRPSFKRILDDLSSADATLKAAGTDPLALAAAATLQAQQAALQQAAVSSLTNPALIPGLLHGMQSLAASVASSTGDMHVPPQIMMQPLQQSLQLQSALLSAASNSHTPSHAPLIAGSATVQSLAGQSAIPATLLSNAINMAASLSNTSVSNTVHPSMLSVSSLSSSGSPGQASPAGQLVDEQGKKREVRLMKNREAARECRRKKKEYVRCLENRVAVLESQNQALIGELRALKELYLPKNNQD